MEKYTGGSIAVICGSILVQGYRETSALTQAVNEIYCLNEALRTRIIEKDGRVWQTADDYAEQKIDILQFDSKEAFTSFAEAYAKEPIPLSGPLCKIQVVLLADCYGLLAKCHHMIGDAWTLTLIASQFNEILAGRKPQVFPYSNYIEREAAYIQGPRYAKDRKFFLEQYEACREITYLSEKSGNSYTASRRTFLIDAEKAAQIREYAKSQGTSPFVFFLTVFSIYFSRIKMNAERFYIGTPILNRGNFKEKNTMGMFINTVPILAHVDYERSFSGNLASIQSAVFSVIRHQKFHYSDVLSAIRQEFNSTETLYDVLISYQNATVTGTDQEVETTWYHNGVQTESLQIHIDDRDSKGFFRIQCDYRLDKLTEWDVQKIYDHTLNLLFDAIAHDTKRPEELVLLSPDEEQRLLHDFNETTVDYPKDKCVHQLFEDQAAKKPDKVALIFEDMRFTYRQLDEMSNSLAHFLRKKNVGRNDIVPIIAKRSWHIIVAMLGILKAGGAYMPVDPAYPKDRIEYMLNTAQCRVSLTFGYEEALEIDTILLDDFDFISKTTPVENVNSAADFCYIIFTSGSTGRPKGVSICHQNVVNYCDNNSNNVCHSIIEENHQNIVSVTNIIFDIFVTESLLPLLNGITIYFANDEQVISQEKMSQLIEANTVDIMQTTPTKMRSYVMDKQNVSYLKSLKVIALGGEALSADLYHELRTYTNAQIFNIYGPAETTVWSTSKKLEGDDITIGRPIANTQIYIVDHNMQLLPIGVTGELCIAGDGVGAGYLNRPELTAEKFINNPFGEGKLYKTGDLAHWREDGNIVYVGRNDFQVKIRGLRIELGEIESVMSAFAGIGLAAAIDKRDETGHQSLVGYYTTDSGIDEKALRQYLSSKLPKYMVPNYLVYLEQMPTTPSGKTDRKSLPTPEFSFIPLEQTYISPRNEKEQTLCRIIGRLLGYAQIGIEDDFFELGGDSLKAIEFVTKAHGAGIYFSLQNVFDYPTVKSLCDYLQGKPRNTMPYEVDRLASYASILQKNTWDPEFIPQHYKLGTIFLTGGTGFLGAHILDALMKRGVDKIYCLVRASSEKLTQRLHYYFGDQYVDKLGKTIIPVIGDLETDGIGANLPEHVDYVIHAAASVKHYGSWSYFKSANVDGTMRIVTYAKRISARLIHISTISVSGNDLADQFDVYVSEEEKHFYESSLYIDQPLDNVYVRSKFEAETVVLDAVQEGLKANIIRVGNLTNRRSDLKFQPNYTENAFLKRVKAVLALGCIPDYLMSMYAEFSPVDSTADAIAAIAAHMNDQYTVFHVNSNRNLYFDRMLEYLEQAGYPMEIMSGDQFAKRIRATIDSQQAYIFEALSNDLSQDDKLQYDTNIHIENSFTVQYLHSLGFEWPEIDYAYIKGYLRYFAKLGYFGHSGKETETA